MRKRYKPIKQFISPGYSFQSDYLAIGLDEPHAIDDIHSQTPAEYELALPAQTSQFFQFDDILQLYGELRIVVFRIKMLRSR